MDATISQITNEYFETTIIIRSRDFEYRFYSTIAKSYFKFEASRANEDEQARYLLDIHAIEQLQSRLRNQFSNSLWRQDMDKTFARYGGANGLWREQLTALITRTGGWLKQLQGLDDLIADAAFRG
ncbi:MAG: hypothetical protein Q9216_005861 [Gyalolechia sp. 2 TL-2023]